MRSLVGHPVVFPKSKFGGNDPDSIAKRKAQATRTAEIYQHLRNTGHDSVVVLGDFNGTPDSVPLQPLLNGSDLRDVSKHPNFDVGEFNVPPSNENRGIGTFGLAKIMKRSITFYCRLPCSAG